MLQQQSDLGFCVEHAHGQLELCDPGPLAPRAQLEIESKVDDDHQLPLTGVKPGAHWRRKNVKGRPVSWHQLDLQLGGIKMRKRRAGAWSLQNAAVVTMANVRAQTYCSADLAALDAVSLPGWARGRWGLTPSEERIMGALWRAYANGTGGVFDCAAVLASDLGMSERTLRYAINGRGPQAATPRLGLVERGLVIQHRTHAPGTNGRKCNDGWVILRIGPRFEEVGIGLVFARDKSGGRFGYSRTQSTKARERASSDARRQRAARAGRAWRSRGGERLSRDRATTPARPSPAGSCTDTGPGVSAEAITQTKAATVADKLTPAGVPLRGPFPPGLGDGRGTMLAPSDPPAEGRSRRSLASADTPGPVSVHEPAGDGRAGGARALAPRQPKPGDDPRWLAMHGIKPEAEHVAAELAAYSIPAPEEPGLAALVADCFRQVYGGAK